MASVAPRMAAGAEVLSSVLDGVAEVTLNRPAALNALNLPMVRALLALYASWARPGSGVRCVVVRGAGGKAFCAGGDVKANVLSARAGPAGAAAALAFFAAEYRMDAAIGALPLPHVALLDGIVMGGGAGAAMHGAFRVATENTLFAMPETAIGLFPDVGMAQLLAALPGELGPWLGLTGARLRGRELKEAGLATHYLPSSALPAAVARIRALGPAASDASAVASALAAAEAEAGAAAGPGPGARGAAAALARRRPLIDALFAGCGGGGMGSGGGGGGGNSAVDGVSRVLRSVREARVGPGDEEWRAETQRQLESASPLSLAVTWEFLRRARASKMGLPACLEQDWALVGHFVAGEGDYWEGVRARLIDKDGRPAWRYRRVEDVPDGEVARLMAAPPGQRRLGLAGGGGAGGAGSRL